MKIKLTSIMVEDQDRALAFYTEVLGFQKNNEIPLGEFKWLTVVSPEGHPDVELSLEPNANPAAKAFQEAMLRQGIPLAAFEVDDIQAEAKRLKDKGVQINQEPDRRRASENCDLLRHLRESNPDLSAGRREIMMVAVSATKLCLRLEPLGLEL
jgi:catechol 2,3-dioxygenase-like lactoylglutathione lyase family enzyme